VTHETTARGALKLVLLPLLVGVLAVPFLLRPRGGAGETVRPVVLPVRKLVLISPHWEGIRTEFERAFSEWTAEHLGHATDLEWLDVGGTSDAIRYVRSEFARSPAGIGIDIFFGGGVDPFMQLAAEDRLAECRLPDEILERIPRQFAGIEVYDSAHRWFGAALSGFGILYNRKVLEKLGIPAPEDWQDLGGPEYETWVGSGDPRSSGSIHMAYEIILQAYGWENGWANIARICANTRNFSRAAGEVPKDAAMGEVACGMAIDVYAWRQVAEVGPDRMGFVLPEGLTVINPDGIAVLKGSPHRELAEHFVAFVLGEPGQKLWCLKRGAAGGPREFELDRMPVIPGFAAAFGDAASVTYDPYKWKSGFTYDPEKGSLRWTILNDLIGATMIDTHRELAAAWREVKGLASDDARMRQFTAPPLSEAELLSLARDRWNDAEFRARTRARWANEARTHYRRLASPVRIARRE